MKGAERQTIRNISSFDEEVSLYKILFQDKATSLLKYLIEKLGIDSYENNLRLPSLIISGREGKSLIAKAFSNSICCCFEHIQGDLISSGGNVGTLYEMIEHQTIIYHISKADKLYPASVSSLLKFMTQGYTSLRNPINKEVNVVPATNKLFIFSAKNINNVNSDLVKAVHYHCRLNSFPTPEQIELIIEQRLRWIGIEYEKEVPKTIVDHGWATIAEGIGLLTTCFLAMRGSNRTRMTVKDVETGIGIYAPQRERAPVAQNDDIPF